MFPNNDYIYDASVALEQLTGLNITVESRRNEYDGIIDINGHDFTVEAKMNYVGKQRFYVYSVGRTQTKNKHPILIIAKYITFEVTLELRENGINYINVAGNWFIKYHLILYTVGQKVHKYEKNNQAKPFRKQVSKIFSTAE